MLQNFLKKKIPSKAVSCNWCNSSILILNVKVRIDFLVVEVLSQNIVCNCVQEKLKADFMVERVSIVFKCLTV